MKKRFPNGRKKPGRNGRSRLVVRYTKSRGEEPCLNYFWQMSDEDYNRPDRPVMKRDINLLMIHFESLTGLGGHSLARELEERGYDITTLQFSIERLKP